MPELGAGISVSTLSVETSSSGSSAETMSPMLFSQRVTVPSVTDSPRAGSTTGLSEPATAWLPERGGLGSGGNEPRAAAAAAAAGATAGRGGGAEAAGAAGGAGAAGAALARARLGQQAQRGRRPHPRHR